MVPAKRASFHYAIAAFTDKTYAGHILGENIVIPQGFICAKCGELFGGDKIDQARLQAI
jgi:hypothetical protein